MVEADKKTFEIILAGLLDFAFLDVDVVHEKFFLAAEAIQVEADGGDVLSQFLAGFLKSKEDARFVVIGGATDQEFEGEKRFAAPGCAGDEGGAIFRQPAVCDLVEP